MLFPSKKWSWRRIAEYPDIRVFGIGERNRNGSDRQLIISGCRPGMKVTLRHDPDHASELAAVAVIIAGGQQIGILDPEIGAQIAPYLASDDVRFTAKVARVGPMEDEKGRMLAGAEIAVLREDYIATDRFAVLSFIGPLSRFVDRQLVKATKGDRFMLTVSRTVAVFLALFLVAVILLSIVSLVRRQFS
ncbi:MAG: HIRAN domain-containing protein [Planctomycetaceae bacterium]